MRKNCVWCDEENKFPFCDEDCCNDCIKLLQKMKKIWGNKFVFTPEEEVVWQNFGK